MHKLDVFIESLKRDFDKGKAAKIHPQYKRGEYLRAKAIKMGDMAEAKRQLKNMQSVRARLPNDPSFRRLYYVRYADD